MADLEIFPYRFRKNVLIDQATGCWEWMAYRDRDGYGQCYTDSNGTRPLKAHRYALSFATGVEVEKGQVVMHSCDNRGCVNPGHLSFGTVQDNIKDKVNKGRQAKGETHGSKTKPDRVARGDRSGMSKLTEKEREEIREKYVKSGKPRGYQTRLAEEYKVSHSLISLIVANM